MLHRQAIAQLHDLGVRIALDDIGAGASSFGCLKMLQVDLLKIDGQYITDLIDDPLHDAAVRSFVEVARIMGLKTVAEQSDLVREGSPFRTSIRVIAALVDPDRQDRTMRTQRFGRGRRI